MKFGAMVCVAALGMGVQPGSGGDRVAPDPGSFGIKAVTRPSQDAVTGFNFSVTIEDVLVKVGDRVVEGQPMVRADATDAEASVELQTLRAESELDVQAAEKALELSQVEFQATKQAYEGGGGSTIELDRARLAAENAKLSLEASRQRMREQQIQLRQLQARLDEHTVTSPFDGIVESVLVDVGDTVRESDPIVRVVSIDPLWIDVATPTEQTLGLKPGDPAWALVRIGDEARLLRATIVGISPVADSVTGARRVRVEASNPDALPAGLQVFVRFTQPDQTWMDYFESQDASGAGDTG
ncbi:MAG TPA: efflux RND transporter periplasmic adaptor subunit [Phycisphaerales bacterium]|nr:efflux RND transporter periplasmic adaptor subunit [Phycisphaerales bacterium]